VKCEIERFSKTWETLGFCLPRYMVVTLLDRSIIERKIIERKIDKLKFFK